MRGDSALNVRLRFSKRGRVRFVSHRDVARAFERAFRIVRLPLQFTEGFAPRPKVAFGLALPLGHESDAEYLDVGLVDEVDVETLCTEVSVALPEGIDVTGAAALTPRAKSLQEVVTSASYRVEVAVPEVGAPPSPAEVTEWVTAALAADRLEGVRRRKGEEVVEDLRPAIRHLEVAPDLSPERGNIELMLEVSTQPRGVRPGEVLAVVGPGLVEGRVLRVQQWIERDGSRLTPLEADTQTKGFPVDDGRTRHDTAAEDHGVLTLGRG